jgi:hypothetical protein
MWTEVLEALACIVDIEGNLFRHGSVMERKKIDLVGSHAHRRHGSK